MRFFKKAAIVTYILIVRFNSEYLIANPDSTKEHCKILFIGSSYFNYNNLPGLFENIVDLSGKEVYIDQQIRNGLFLDDHANSTLTEAKINSEDWDYVILQGVGRETAYPDIYTDHPVYPALVALRDKIFANCESTQMVFCLPWAFEDGMAWLEGWTDTYEDMQIKIIENTLQYSKDLDFVIAPVGWVWNTVLREKNYPLHYLHLNDWNHPSLRGSYLMACVVFSTIFQESTTEIQYYADLPEDEANYFQIIASETVLDSLDLWNIMTTYIETIEFSTPNKFCLHQNYPNPFNSITTINYTLEKSGFISLKIYDLIGREIDALVNKFQTATSYLIHFDARKLSSGIYFYTIQINNEFKETQKMVLLR
ncbi:T9SS type A sorting domain-containing protein [Bacteroidota bacterium]